MKAISTKYVGPSNVRGARIIATDGDDNRVIVSYDHASTQPHRDAALALCRKMEWTGDLHEGVTKTGHVFVWDDPDDLIRV